MPIDYASKLAPTSTAPDYADTTAMKAAHKGFATVPQIMRLLAANEGLRVIPMFPKDGKMLPGIAWKDDPSSADPSQIQEWSQRFPAFGFYLQSGAVVEDYDVKNAAFETDEQRTAFRSDIQTGIASGGIPSISKSGGIHLRFANRDYPKARAVKIKEYGTCAVDVLSEGLCCIYAPQNEADLDAPMTPYPKGRFGNAPAASESNSDPYGYRECNTVKAIVAKMLDSNPSLGRNNLLTHAAYWGERKGKWTTEPNGGTLKQLLDSAIAMFGASASQGEIDSAIASGRKKGAEHREVQAKEAEEAEEQNDAAQALADSPETLWKDERIVFVVGNGSRAEHSAYWALFNPTANWGRTCVTAIKHRLCTEIVDLMRGPKNARLTPAVTRSQVNGILDRLQGNCASADTGPDRWNVDTRYLLDADGNMVDTKLMDIMLADNPDHPVLPPDSNYLLTMRLGAPLRRPNRPDLEMANDLLLDWANGDPEQASFLKRRAGYMLLPNNPERKIFNDFGVGANGKTSYNSVIGDALGDYGTTAMANWLQADSGQNKAQLMAKMAFKRMCVVSEMTKKNSDDSLLKHISGAKNSEVKFLYIGEYDLPITAKLVIEGNHRLKFSSASSTAMADRLVCFSWDARFTDYAKGKKTRDFLESDRGKAAMLWLAYEGLTEYNRHGFPICKRTEDASREAMELSQSPHERFFAECLVDTGNRDDLMPVAQAFATYKNWAEHNNIGTQRSFNQAIADMHPDRFRNRRNNTQLNKQKIKAFWGFILAKDAAHANGSPNLMADAPQDPTPADDYSEGNIPW